MSNKIKIPVHLISPLGESWSGTTKPSPTFECLKSEPDTFMLFQHLKTLLYLISTSLTRRTYVNFANTFNYVL